MRAMKTEMTRINGQNRGPRLAMLLCLLLLSGPGVRASDTDKDFMEDSWELIHGLDPNDANDAFFDLDQDSFANLCEYLHASDPRANAQK